MSSDPTLLGTVQDVKGAAISVSLDATTLSGLAFIKGHGYRIGQVGSFIRIPMGYIDLFGIVSQVGAGSVPEKIAHLEIHGYRWMTVQLVGEGGRSGDFNRGISQYPTVGDQVLSRRLTRAGIKTGVLSTVSADQCFDSGGIGRHEGPILMTPDAKTCVFGYHRMLADLYLVEGLK